MTNTTVTTTDDDTDKVEGTEVEETDEGTETDTETEDDGDDAEDEEAAVIATFTPAQAALWTKHQEALTKANANARSKRLALKALRSGQQASATGPKPTAPKTTGKPDAFDPEAFKTALLAELQGVQQADKVQRAAERGLKAAGLALPSDPDAAERKLVRVMRMLDLEGSTVDDVADEIDDLKADNPELFATKRKRPRTGGVSGPNTIRTGSAKKPEDDLFD
jgi:hypothetical protein